MHRLKSKLLEGRHAEIVDKSGNFARYLLRRFIDDRCFESAGSLSYTSILAVVPFATVVFAVLAAFPAFEQWTDRLSGFVFRNFVPDVAANVESGIRAFAASAGALPIKGLIGLLLTVGLTMWAVESAFNRIWRVPAPKPKLLRFLVYWSLLTIGSLLIVSLLALNSALSVYVNLADYTPGFLDGAGLAAAPLLIGFIGLSAAYWLIPHRQVPLRHAMIGAVIATILFELLKWLFRIYLQSVSFQQIYGALAVLPIALVWLYSVWLVVLLGASITATLSSFRYRPRAVRAAKGIDFYWVLRLVARLQDAKRRGERLTYNTLSVLEPNIAESKLRSHLAGLAEIGLLQCDSHDHWWLDEALSQFTLGDLHQGLGLRIPLARESLPLQGDGIDARVMSIIETLRGSLHAPLQYPLSRCFEEIPVHEQT